MKKPSISEQWFNDNIASLGKYLTDLVFRFLSQKSKEKPFRPLFGLNFEDEGANQNLYSTGLAVPNS